MGQEHQNPKRIAFLYPGFAAEDDYPFLAKAVDLPVEVEVLHTDFKEDAHRVDALKDMGDPVRLREGARQLKGKGIDAVLWTSTSASFVYGWEGAQRQIEVMEETLGVPASTTAFAFVDAIKTMGYKQVAVAATYPEDIAERFKQFLQFAEIEVLQVKSKGIITAAEVGTFGKDAVLKMVTENDHPDAEALLVPDTALHSAAWLDELEEAVGKPVLTANQVSFWKTLQLAGIFKPQNNLGTLFKHDNRK